jgi:hypothetical protein
MCMLCICISFLGGLGGWIAIYPDVSTSFVCLTLFSRRWPYISTCTASHYASMVKWRSSPPTLPSPKASSAVALRALCPAPSRQCWGSP